MSLRPLAGFDSRRRALIVATVVSASSAGFGFVQNTLSLRGGQIAAPKVLWLNLTLLVFIALPMVFSRSAGLPRRLRSLFGVIAISFLVRGAAELVVLYFTNWWRCAYGIAHDLTTAAVVAALWWRSRSATAGDGLIVLTLALLVVEAAFAWAFCSIMDPAAGWFAHEDPVFDTIIKVTWGAVLVAYPLYGLLTWRALGTEAQAGC